MRSLWLRIYCGRLAGVGNLSHEEVSGRGHNLPSPDRGKQRPRQGAVKSLLGAQKKQQSLQQKAAAGILDTAAWREEPFQQDHPGSPTLPASALSTCALRTPATFSWPQTPSCAWVPHVFRVPAGPAPADLDAPVEKQARAACFPRPGGSSGSQHPFSDTAASSVRGSCWIAAAAMLMASSRLCCSSNCTAMCVPLAVASNATC